MQILKKHAKPYRREIALSMLAVVIMAGASLWQPRLLQQVMNAIIADNQQAVWSNGIALISLAVIGLLAGVINTIFAAKVSQGIAADIRADEYRKIQSFSFGRLQEIT
ncbi:hypothetical protein GCM10008913_11550 [Leuconostoc lactis KCTC 3528 = DSM 20202]|nr:hypothetical protein GCM10008913_11550 [Leuconostoc lactis KCTC 3528 = DSM 20202]